MTLKKAVIKTTKTYYVDKSKTKIGLSGFNSVLILRFLGMDCHMIRLWRESWVRVNLSLNL